MEIGTGIFLSAIFLGFIALFISTKDRWKWKKILLILLGLPIIIGLLVWGGITSYEWFKETFPPAVKKQNGINQIMLGMTKDEILYAKGQPSELLSDIEENGKLSDFKLVIKSIPDGKSAMDYDSWSYDDKYGDSLLVTFNHKTNKAVNIICTSGESNYSKACEIQGLTVGLSEEELLRRVGKPKKSDIESSVKRMYYPDLNLQINLEKKKVYLISISEGAE